MADAIRKLIEAVEAGDEDAMMENARALWRADLDRGIVPDIDPYGMAKAFNGSLDAAKALHDALLPGWEWACGWKDGEYLGGVAENNLPASKNVCHDQPNPARAWLLAILRAMEAEGRG